MFSLTLYDPFHGSARHHGEPLTAQTDGPGVVNQKIKSAKVSLDSAGRLVVKVDSSALLRVSADEKPFVIKMDRETTYYMVQDAHHDWKIDGWNGHYETGKVHPEK